MDIILLKNYEGLGSAGDIVSVKPGYARNKLIPEGIGLRASKKNLAISIEKKQIEICILVHQDSMKKILRAYKI
jgi:large subunit ribosomal protein L9